MSDQNDENEIKKRKEGETEGKGRVGGSSFFRSRIRNRWYPRECLR